MKIRCTFLSVFFFCSILAAQDRAPVGPQDKVMVYVTDMPDWTVRKEKIASGGETKTTATLSANKGIVSRAIDYFYKKKECRAVAMTMDPSKASYAFVLDGWASGLVHDVRIMVVDLKTQEVIYAGHTQMMSNMVKDACNAVIRATGK